MVFIHGRGQEFKDPAVLARTWQAGLAAGLTKVGRPQLAGVPVVFPRLVGAGGQRLQLDRVYILGYGWLTFGP
jgi:hypothetical protein